MYFTLDVLTNKQRMLDKCISSHSTLPNNNIHNSSSIEISTIKGFQTNLQKKNNIINW